MRSVTSCFNAALWKKNLTRFWPIWGLYGLIWAFVLPVSLVLSLADRAADAEAAARFAHYQVYTAAAGFTVPMSAFFGILAAMAVLSYLYTARSAGFFHTLPIRREGLFLTSYLSGLTFFLLPDAAIFLITLAAEGAAGAVNLPALLVWLLAQILCALFFFSFAVFCGMFTGNLLALPVFYIILNFLATGLSIILQGTLSFLYGFVYAPVLDTAARWLTPVWRLMSALQVRSNPDSCAETYEAGLYYLSGLGYAILYAAAGLVLAALALAVYRRRRLETAGDIVSVGWVRPVFRYGVAACAALAFGSLLYGIFSYALPQTAWTLFVFMALWGVIGYFAAEMLLQKSFRVFGRWRGCVVLVACLAVFAASLEYDFTGFETRVPDPARVVSVRVTAVDSAPYDDAAAPDLTITDPEAVAEVTEIHRRFTELRDRDPAEVRTLPEDAAVGYASLRVDYTLEDGGTLSRYYPAIWIALEDLEDPDSLAARLSALINRPENIRAAYRLDRLEASANVLEVSAGLYERGEMEWTPVTDPADCLAIRDAVLADFADGALGRRYLIDGDPERLENTYFNDLLITYMTPAEGDGEPSAESVEITLTPQAARTLAALEAAGLSLDGGALRTHAQDAAQD